MPGVVDPKMLFVCGAEKEGLALALPALVPNTEPNDVLAVPKPWGVVVCPKGPLPPPDAKPVPALPRAGLATAPVPSPVLPPKPLDANAPPMPCAGPVPVPPCGATFGLKMPWLMPPGTSELWGRPEAAMFWPMDAAALLNMFCDGLNIFCSLFSLSLFCGVLKNEESKSLL